MDLRQQVRDEIKRLNKVLDLLGGGGEPDRPVVAKKTRRPMSAEARQRIGEAARKRWAERRTEGAEASESAAASEPSPTGRKSRKKR